MVCRIMKGGGGTVGSVESFSEIRVFMWISALQFTMNRIWKP
jgi:hypothetical protein